MESEAELLNLISSWNTHQNFSKNFQSYAQHRIQDIANNSRVIHVGKDMFIQIDEDTFRRINVDILRKFEGVQEIIFTNIIISEDPCAYGYYVNGHVEDNIVFKCRDIKDVLVYFYDNEKYLNLFAYLEQTNDFEVSMHFKHIAVVYVDGSFINYNDIESFMYDFLNT